MVKLRRLRNGRGRRRQRGETAEWTAGLTRTTRTTCDVAVCIDVSMVNLLSWGFAAGANRKRRAGVARREELLVDAPMSGQRNFLAG
jgi:hypothetical protein